MDSSIEHLLSAKFGPVGQCIYCGSRDNLSSEHVIPYSLSGTMEMLAASCASCAKITCTFEGAVARTIFGNLRMRFGFNTRRKKDRPTTLPIVAVRGEKRSLLDLPIKNHPAPTPIVWLDTPSILCGRDEREGCPFRILMASADAITPATVGADQLECTTNFAPFPLGRFLAKIAHCVTVLQYGIGGF